jgi:hypothetical protein
VDWVETTYIQRSLLDCTFNVSDFRTLQQAIYEHEDHVPSKTELASLVSVHRFKFGHSVRCRNRSYDWSANGRTIDRLQIITNFGVTASVSKDMCKLQKLTDDDISRYTVFSLPPSKVLSIHKIGLRPASHKAARVANPPGPAPMTIASYVVLSIGNNKIEVIIRGLWKFCKCEVHC